MTTLNSKCHNRKRHPCLYNAERFFVCQKCYITYATWAVVICLICPHLPSGAARPRACAYISGKSLLPMLHIYMGGSNLPDMYARARGRVQTYQANHDRPCYICYVTLLAYEKSLCII